MIAVPGECLMKKFLAVLLVSADMTTIMSYAQSGASITCE